MPETYLTSAEVCDLPDGTLVNIHYFNYPTGVRIGEVHFRRGAKMIRRCDHNGNGLTPSAWHSFGARFTLYTQPQIDAQTALDALRDKCHAFVETASQAQLEAIEKGIETSGTSA